ncbi:MAG: 2-oxo acid dehydrogenase subunit E2 [Alphaproteobacteria bacterium]|nr:2-oxo acid dehydrogenase subunit E2 [Alphaproteobacteria bacterium]
MPVQILMPALSPDMSEGKIAKWRKAEGEPVSPGDVLAEVETDKATLEVEATSAGVLGRILAGAGVEGIAVGTPIALLLEVGEDPGVLSGAISEIVAAGRARSAEAWARSAESLIPPSAGRSPFEPPATEVPHSTTRKTIARRMALSTRSAPHFYLTVEFDVDPLLEARRDLNAKAQADAGEGKPAYKLSVNDFMILAAALALRKVPDANVSWRDDVMLHYTEVDIAVAVDTPNGLITPVIRNADRKGLAEISGEMKMLAGKAREGKLAPEDYSGGSFTISNLGMFGIKKFSAIINPPQACILSLGIAEQRAVVRRNALAIATMMTCTLSVDHRAVDGATGARYLRAFKGYVEHPLTLAL